MKIIRTLFIIALILSMAGACIPCRAQDPSPEATSAIGDPSPAESPEASPEATVAPTPSPSPVKPAQPELSDYEKEQRARSRKELAAKLSSYIKNDDAWSRAKVGIYVARVEDGGEVFSHNGNLPMIPASNLKVITTAAALSVMGPDYRFKTSLRWGAFDPKTGAIDGNLYLVGNGDPTLMEPFTGDPTALYRRFADFLKKKGVRRISGDLVGDDSAFDREFLGRGWKSRYILCDYAAPCGALSINGNCVGLVINGGVINMQPSNKSVQIVHTPGGGAVAIDRKAGTDVVTVRGNAGGNTYRSLTVNNPSSFATSSFAQILAKRGIKIEGKVRLISDKDSNYTASTTEMASHKSIPLHKIVRQINKESDNICAQHVFKSVGHNAKGQGTCDNANEAIREIMKSAGIDITGFAMADGSGLSVYNRITPRQMCGMLIHMTSHKHWKYFWDSLPIAGKDGTLIYRMAGSPVRAKTGGLQGHIALSGYVTTGAGQKLVFAIFSNRHRTTGDRIRQNEDWLVQTLARWNRKF